MGQAAKGQAAKGQAFKGQAFKGQAFKGQTITRAVTGRRITGCRIRGGRIAGPWSLACVAQIVALAALAAGAAAASEPTGIWYDHTGRGAVEITNCGSALCGRVVWLRDAGNRGACGLQIIGNVHPAKDGAWDGGWIYDPDKGAKYSVEITPIGTRTLKVVGYMGSKLLSETMMWRRAPADLKRCHV